MPDSAAGIDTTDRLPRMKAVAVALLFALAGCAPDHPTTVFTDDVKAGNVEQVEAHIYWCQKDGGCDLAKMLLKAVMAGQADVTELLIDAGVDVNKPGLVGMTYLHYAVPHADVAKVLLDAGANVNARNNFGSTPLYLAERLKHADTAALLRSHGGVEAGSI